MLRLRHYENLASAQVSRVVDAAAAEWLAVEEQAHTIRERMGSWGVRRTKLYAFGARAALKHRALGPSRLARVFLSSDGRYTRSQWQQMQVNIKISAQPC